MKRKALLRKILQGNYQNVGFGDLVGLAEGFGFRLDRIRGSHHIFLHREVPIPLNLQSARGQAIPYQVRQLLRLVERYNLSLEDDAE
jgi:hypothetical protein